MRNFKNRLESLEAAFAPEPGSDAVDRVRRHLAVGLDLDDDDLEAVRRCGSIVGPTPTGVAIADGHGCVKRIVGVQFDDA